MSKSKKDASTAGSSNTAIITFLATLCTICAVVLALMASSLAARQDKAKELDRSKQMLIAAQVFSPNGYFQLASGDSQSSVPAKWDAAKGMLVPGAITDKATPADILGVYQACFTPFLTDSQGDITTFEQLGLSEQSYLAQYRKSGYAKLQWKLIYAIEPNLPPEERKAAKPIGFIIPINGFGLWDAIYGYLAIKADGDTVIGTTWYDQKETPGLGAEISEAKWQGQFPGKKIFQQTTAGEVVNFTTAPMGITVVRGKVSDALGTSSPKAASAVDGIAGATLTGNGVTAAYKDSLQPYRNFIVRYVGGEISKI